MSRADSILLLPGALIHLCPAPTPERGSETPVLGAEPGPITDGRVPREAELQTPLDTHEWRQMFPTCPSQCPVVTDHPQSVKPDSNTHLWRPDASSQELGLGTREGLPHFWTTMQVSQAAGRKPLPPPIPHPSLPPMRGFLDSHRAPGVGTGVRISGSPSAAGLQSS